jgi:hypothetical protein
MAGIREQRKTARLNSGGKFDGNEDNRSYERPLQNFPGADVRVQKRLLYLV